MTWCLGSADLMPSGSTAVIWGAFEASGMCGKGSLDQHA